MVLLAAVFIVIPAAFLVAVVVSFVTKDLKKKRTARIVAISSFIVGVLIAGGIWLGLRWFFGDEPPTLTELQEQFPSRRQNLETILRMSDEDPKFSRIALDFLDRKSEGQDDGGRFMQGDPKAGLSVERWNIYRDLYKKTGIRLGIQRDQDGNGFIMADSIGLLNSGHVTGYLYCRDPGSAASQTSDFEPCKSATKDSGSQEFSENPKLEAYSFKKVADHWFVFDQGPS